MATKKAQIGMEFMIIISALMFFITIFFLMVQENTEDKIYQRESLIIKEIATTVQKEINLAKDSSDGYSRNFELPKKAGNLDYEINVTSGFIFIRTTNGKHSLSLLTEELTGEINITDNVIKKVNGEIFLN